MTLFLVRFLASRTWIVMIQVFHSVDEDGSGSIQVEELEGAMLKLGFNMSRAKCRDLLKTIDTNSDGSVSFE